MNSPKDAYELPEQTQQSEYTLATYYMEVDSDMEPREKAIAMALGQSIGTWTSVPGITDEMLHNHLARVVNLYSIPPVELIPDLPPGRRAFLVQIAYPEVNFGPSLPMLMTTVLGNDVSTATRLKLLNLQVSPVLADQLGGPRFGIVGLRKLTGVTKRPMILNVLKPCTGFRPQEAVSWFEESARGGSDIIKDDELLSNPSFNQLSLRVKLFHKAALRVHNETGHRVLYCANVTDRADLAIENARRAVELGADMIMVNAITAGLGVLQALAALEEINVPILAHFAGFMSQTEGRVSGLSSALLLGKLMRLAGADAVSFPSPYSGYPILPENAAQISQNLSLPLYNLKPAMPNPGGGIHPVSAAYLVKSFGTEIMLTVGGGIQGHPQGTAAGVRALKAAIEAVMDGVSLEEKARETSELQVALEYWGED